MSKQQTFEYKAIEAFFKADSQKTMSSSQVIDTLVTAEGFQASQFDQSKIDQALQDLDEFKEVSPGRFAMSRLTLKKRRI